MSVGFPTHGFFADNRGEFSNMKLDELTSKLGLTVNCNLTVRKLLEEKKMALNDSLIKAAAWTYNTSVNKLGYTPFN